MARQIQHVLTQTLTRHATTFTTLVTLGSMDHASSVSNIEPKADIPGSQDDLSGVQLGAILGSIAAVVVVVFIIVASICLASNQKGPTAAHYRHSDGSYDTPSMTGAWPPSKPRPEKPRHPPRVAELIPGGVPYPTYRAIPIPNSRNPPALKRDYT